MGGSKAVQRTSTTRQSAKIRNKTSDRITTSLHKWKQQLWIDKPLIIRQTLGAVFTLNISTKNRVEWISLGFFFFSVILFLTLLHKNRKDTQDEQGKTHRILGCCSDNRDSNSM